MRILILTKRQYTGKDLLSDRYGRLYEIPAALARRGHGVSGVALSYRHRKHGWLGDPALSNLDWQSFNALSFGGWKYPWELLRLAGAVRPDVIWACSDAFHAIIGDWLARRTGIPLVIDLYDNFESFSATRLPGVRRLFRAACRRATGLTVVTKALGDYVTDTYRLTRPYTVVGNGVRKDLFYPRDRRDARKALGLPLDARIIGTAGAISADRDIGTLFDAFLVLAADDPHLHLAYAGPRDATPSRYSHPRIHDLGLLPLERVPGFLSALDVAVVANRDSAFGRYCFPLKLVEIAACGTPLVAASLGDVATLLASDQGCLYRAGDSMVLAQRIYELLRAPYLPIGLAVPSWDDLSVSVEAALVDAVGD